jgi:probable F420-dependent oxidoreductase
MSLRFGVNLFTVGSRTEFADTVRRVDELGFDLLAAPDHLGALSPFAALTAAAGLSERLRLRTYVLNVGFWNPALLAREVAGVDLLSGGRVEVGLGAGHARAEHEDAGLPWAGHRDRVRALEDTVVELRRRLDDPAHQPRPAQDRVPLMIGAMSESGLDLAARQADLVGLAGLRQVPGAEPGVFTLSSAAETDDRVGRLRDRAGEGRPLRCDLLLQAVVLGEEPEQAAARMAAQAPGRLDVDQLLDSPFALFAHDAEGAAAEVERRRERFDLDSVTTHQPNLEPFGEVLAAYRRRYR